MKPHRNQTDRAVIAHGRHACLCLSLTMAFSTGILLPGCANPPAASRLHSDSGVDGPEYAAIQSALTELADQHPDWVRLETYGSVGRDSTPLLAITLGLTQEADTHRGARPAVFISGTTHGNEYLGIESELPHAFIKELQAGQSPIARWLRSGGLFYIIPIANPSGYQSDRRSNGSADLNRDFPLRRGQHAGLTQPETRLQLDWLEQTLQKDQSELRLTLDYHCCSADQEPDLIYPWGYSSDPDDRAIPQELELYAGRLGNLARRALGDIDFGNTIDILGYAALGASDDHYFEEHFVEKGTLGMSFTLEGLRQSASSRENPNRLDRHLKLWNSWARELLDTITPQRPGLTLLR